MRITLIILLTVVSTTAYAQERFGILTDKKILRKEKFILGVAKFMIETKTKRLMYDSLGDDDALKLKMKKLGVDFVRLRYIRNDFDPGDSTITFQRPLEDFWRNCGEDIIYDFSKYGKNYLDEKGERSEFRRVKDRIYYLKDCNVTVRP